MDEKLLIESCKSHNSSAQEKLYRLYSPRFYGLCRRYVYDLHHSEDILVSGFTKIFLNIKQYTNQGSFEGWMRKIIVNECLMFIRKNKKITPAIEIEDHILDVKLSDDFDIISELSKDEILIQINLLPDGYKSVFNLFVIEGYKHREIAEILNISINTSKSQLILAKKKMISLLKENLNRKHGK